MSDNHNPVRKKPSPRYFIIPEKSNVRKGLFYLGINDSNPVDLHNRVFELRLGDNSAIGVVLYEDEDIYIHPVVPQFTEQAVYVEIHENAKDIELHLTDMRMSNDELKTIRDIRINNKNGEQE